MSRFSWYMDSYLALSDGLMYQSKPSLSPGVSESSSTCSNCTCLPVRARFACTRWDLDSGTSQSGSVAGTSAYSYCFRSLFSYSMPTTVHLIHYMYICNNHHI